MWDEFRQKKKSERNVLRAARKQMLMSIPFSYQFQNYGNNFFLCVRTTAATNFFPFSFAFCWIATRILFFFFALFLSCSLALFLILMYTNFYSYGWNVFTMCRWMLSHIVYIYECFLSSLFLASFQNNIPSCFERCVFFSSSGGSSLCACYSFAISSSWGYGKKIIHEGRRGRRQQQQFFFTRSTKRRKIIKLAKFFFFY